MNHDFVQDQLLRLLDQASNVDAAVVVTTDGLFYDGVSRDDAFDQATFETFSAALSGMSAAAKQATGLAAEAVAQRRAHDVRPGEIRLGITGVQVVPGANGHKGWLAVCPVGHTAWLALFAFNEPNFGMLGTVVSEFAAALADTSSPPLRLDSTPAPAPTPSDRTLPTRTNTHHLAQG